MGDSVQALFKRQKRILCSHDASSVSGKDMEETMKAEIEEIEKYKWCLGERIGHDPLADRSMNEICKEWIQQYARSFRENWKMG
jgi:hypothetical protein